MLFSKEELRRLIVPLMIEQILAVTIGMALWSLGTTSLIVRKHLGTESCFTRIKGYQNMGRLDSLK